MSSSLRLLTPRSKNALLGDYSALSHFAFIAVRGAVQTVDGAFVLTEAARFGPVRTVRPEIVCELAFEGIQASPRHKAGIAVRFPRIARLRRDKPIQEADTLEQVRTLLPRGA